MRKVYISIYEHDVLLYMGLYLDNNEYMGELMIWEHALDTDVFCMRYSLFALQDTVVSRNIQELVNLFMSQVGRVLYVPFKFELKHVFTLSDMH